MRSLVGIDATFQILLENPVFKLTWKKAQLILILCGYLYACLKILVFWCICECLNDIVLCTRNVLSFLNNADTRLCLALMLVGIPLQRICTFLATQKGRWSSKLEHPVKGARVYFSNHNHLSRLREGGGLLQTAVTEDYKGFHVCLAFPQNDKTWAWVIYLEPCDRIKVLY